jgi:allophanate hydrolase
MKSLEKISLDAVSLARGYRDVAFKPSDVIEEVYRRIEARGDHAAWLYLVPKAEALARAAEIEAKGRTGLQPLYGLPYGVKDNIDVAGWPTTAGCSALQRVPERSAAVVEKLDAAGAINLGKQNMDQFATGLVGVRTTGPAARNAFDARYIPGGSSSGSAVAVAAGFTTFSIGSDTGGSGRVPAAYNNIVGLKPTPGRVSSRGFLYCNRTFDVPPVFALTVADAYTVLRVIEGHDAEDAYSTERRATEPLQKRWSFRFALPRRDQLEFFGDDAARRHFGAVVDHLRALGGTAVEIDFAPFVEAGRLVFNSPLIAERWLTYGALIEQQPDSVHPVVAQAISNAQQYSAADAFATVYRLQELQGIAHRALANVDVLATPTVGTLYTTAQLAADPVQLNNRMGHYTYFANPLRLAAISVPAGLREDGLPFGLSLAGLPFSEALIGSIAAAVQQRLDTPMGATDHRPSRSME